MFSNLKLNKRGDISVAVMVILTIVLFVYVLGAMNSDLAKISGNFNDVSKLEQVYSNHQLAETTLYFRLMEVSLNSYKEVLEENSMKIGDPNLDLNALFKAKVETNFKNYNGKSEEMKEFFGKVNSFEFDGTTIKISTSVLQIEENLSSNKEDNSKVYYSSSLNSSFNLNRVGLPGIDALVISHGICSEVTDSEVSLLDCLNEEFPQFDAGYNRVVPGQVHMVSKDSYYLNKKIELIAFNLMFNHISKTSS
jgi:hypothetical protein